MAESVPSTVTYCLEHEPAWSDWGYRPVTGDQPEQWERWCWEPYCAALDVRYEQPRDGA